VAAARVAAEKMTDDAVVRLRKFAGPELGFDLHTKIIESTGNPIYLSLYQSISDLLAEIRHRAARVPAVRRRAHNDHLAIVAAIGDHEPEAAARAMHDHLEAMRSALGEILSQRPTNGEHPRGEVMPAQAQHMEPSSSRGGQA
jgi:DNA-binding FadR family transcriptional regulator